MPHAASVWLLDCRTFADEALARFAGWLDRSEVQRLERFVRPERRRQYLAGHALARQALGRLLELPPETVGLVEQPGAAPLAVVPGGGTCGLSISHSGHWVACAASATTRVGLDIELIDATRDIDQLAAQAFDPEQQAWLAKRPAATRMRDFYQLWSAAEARFKLQAPCADQIEFSHPALSVVLCCEHALALRPQLQAATLENPRSPTAPIPSERGFRN
ncbi:MAG: 4'-phosphopantetheinyl transferase family protein [Massilia sp.]